MKKKELRIAIFGDFMWYFSGYKLMKLFGKYRLVLDYDRPQVIFVSLISLDKIAEVVTRYDKACVRLFVSGENIYRYHPQPGKTHDMCSMIGLVLHLCRKMHMPWTITAWLFKILMTLKDILPTRLMYYQSSFAKLWEEQISFANTCPGAYYIHTNKVKQNRSVSLPYVMQVKNHIEYFFGRSEHLYPLTDPQLLNRKFCCIVISNPASFARIDFALRLKKYKHIDMFGRTSMTNASGYERTLDKQWAYTHELYKDYKFVISFENTRAEDYLTEKLLLALTGNSVPIYWGDTNVALSFNPQRFVNYADHNDWQSMMDRVVALDQDDEAYLACVKAPFYTEQNKAYLNKRWQDYDRFLARIRTEIDEKYEKQA